jgi:hypothetical protein
LAAMTVGAEVLADGAAGEVANAALTPPATAVVVTPVCIDAAVSTSWPDGLPPQAASRAARAKAAAVRKIGDFMIFGNFHITDEPL